MALVDEIAVKLGIDNAKFKQALREADSEIKKFKKAGAGKDAFEESLQSMRRGVNDLRSLLAGGGMIAAINTFYQTAISAANKSTDANDENAAAVRRFGQELTEAKGLIPSMSVAILGFLNRAGEGWGSLILRMKGVNTEQQFLIEGIQKETDAQAKRFATANEIRKIERDSAFERADLLGKAKILLQDNVELEIKMRKEKAGSVELAKLEAQYQKNYFDAGKLIADQEKKTAEVRAKTAEDLKKIQDSNIKYAQESVKLDEQLAKIAFDKLTPEQQLGELRKKELALQKTIKDVNADENVIKKAKVELSSVQRQISEASLVIEENIVTEEEKLVEAKKKATEEDEKQLNLLKEKLVQTVKLDAATMKRTNQGEDSRLSDRELQEKINNLQKTISDAQVRRQRGDSVYIDPTDLNKAVEEQNLRNNFRRTASLVGTERALGQYSAFDEDRLRALVEGRDLQKENSKDLKEIKDHIVSAFPIN